jgi:hypothetical protein
VSLYGEALELAAHGYKVFPCRWQDDGKFKAKAPLTVNGFKDAVTIDPRDGQSAVDAEHTIHDWWTRWPKAMLGMVVPDKVIILDVDPRNGGDITALGKLPPTYCVLSGRGDGGVHLYYTRPTLPLGARFTATRLPEGIDLKHNGYVISPPSLHPETGKPYVAISRPVVALPDRIRDLIIARPPDRQPTGGGDGEGLVEFVGKAINGNRNNALYWAACTSRTEGTLDKLADRLVDAAVANGLTEFEARRTVHSAERGD